MLAPIHKEWWLLLTQNYGHGKTPQGALPQEQPLVNQYGFI